MQVPIPDLAQPLRRLALDGEDGIDLAPAQHVDCEPRLAVHQMRLDAQPFEHVDRRHEGAGIRLIDDDRLAVEILQTSDRPRCEDVHLLVEQLGDVDELLVDAAGEVLALKIGKGVLAYNSGIHAPQQQDVRDRLSRSAAEHRQHPEALAIVQHRTEIGADLGIGAAERAGHHGHGVGVQLDRQIAFGGTVLEDRLEGFADAAGIDAAAHRAEAFPFPFVNRCICICSIGA